METTEIKLRIIKSKKEDFVEDEPLWVGRYYYPKCKVGTTETIYNSRSISNAISILFDSFGSTCAWNFIARQSDCTKEEFIQEILSISRPVVEKLLVEDENKRKKYPINELYYLRYDLWSADDAGEHRHPSEVIKELGGKELRFDGCPIADCDLILVQFDNTPTLPNYIKDISTDKKEKDQIKKKFPEFILEE